MYSKKIYYKYRYLPLAVSLLYITATFLLSVVGPVEYFNNEYHYMNVMLFLIGVLMMLSIGFYLGCVSRRRVNCRNQHSVFRRERLLLKLSLIISITSLIIEFIHLLNANHISVRLSSLGALYSTRIQNPVFVMSTRIISAPFRALSNILGLHLFHRQKNTIKIAIVLNILLYLIVFLFGYGNQKGVSDIVIYIALAIGINRISTGRRMSSGSMKFIIVLFITVFILFSHMQYLRYEPLGINAFNFHRYSTGEFYYNTNHIIFRIFGYRLGFGMASILNGYLSQGYYGLSLCMQLPFRWSYGVGGSYALISFLNKVGIDGIFERTYIGRMAAYFSRDGLRSWNTIFPWIASDYTWSGAAIFFFAVGFIMAKTWREVIVNHNIISYLVMTEVVVLILFTPANNQLFHGYDSFITTCLFLIAWIVARGRFMHEEFSV